MDRIEKAKKLFSGEYNCSQSVFAAYSEKFGIKEDDALKISAGFGGGIGRSQETCGAISGAVMILGCRYYDKNDALSTKELVYNKTSELLDRFRKINKSTKCIDLTGVDLSKDFGRELFKTMKIHETVCSKCISDVCGILEEMI